MARQSKDPVVLGIDVGSTTSDIIPIVDGKPAAQGLTDMDRHQRPSVWPLEPPPQACERETEAKDRLPGHVEPDGGSGALAIWHTRPLSRSPWRLPEKLAGADQLAIDKDGVVR